MKSICLPSGQTVPALGQGTWAMGHEHSRRDAEVAALRLGLDLGMTLIDTAEMYADGGAEEVVGKAIAGRRDDVFLVSKVYPHNATREGAVAACERSLKRLNTDCLDLYLLHWRGNADLAETLEAFQTLRKDGKIRHHGVSNFDTDDMREWIALPGGDVVATNQILYNLSRRSPEGELLPWHREHGVPIMAYSPVEQGRILDRPVLATIAARHGKTPAQVALAWLLRQEGVIVIPKASDLNHVRDNRAAVDLALTAEDWAELDRAFPRPEGPKPLEML